MEGCELFVSLVSGSFLLSRHQVEGYCEIINIKGKKNNWERKSRI